MPNNQEKSDSKTILIIEDDAGVSELLKERLNDAGYEVVTAESAVEAQTYLETHTPDLMLVDYGLPDVNGKEFIETLKKQQRRLPDFIVSTGLGDERIAVRMMKLGARDYVVKDGEFLDRIPEVVGRVHKEIENENKLKQAREALRKSVMKYRQVVENATEGIVIIQDNAYCYVNQRAAEIFSTTREDILSRELYAFVHPDDKAECARRVSLRKQGEETDELLVHRIIDAKGNVKWVEVRGVSIIWEGRHASMCFVIDITERKQAQEALELERKQLLSIFDSIDEIIYTADTDTYEILYVNQAMRKAFGDKKLVGGLCYKEFQNFDAPCDFCTNAIIVKEKPAPHRWEYYNPIIDRHLAIVDRIIKWPDGRDVRFELAIDITDRKRAEEEKAHLEDQYRQAQRVEAVGRLAGGVAHDLNNLLVPILGYGEILMDDFGPGDVRRDSIKQIVDAGYRARNLVRQLLAFTRKQNLKLNVVNLNDIIKGFEKLMRRTIREDINIEIILAPGTQKIRADVGQIEQVVMNLVVNAQDAMPEGGRWLLETAMDAVDEKTAVIHQNLNSGLYVTLSVSDSGCGMDAETRDKIFEPFFSTKGKHGTGMGLATVYGIIKNHGGKISVYSEKDAGSVFKIYLPVYQGVHDERQQMEQSDNAPGGSETILLVEDNEQVRNLTESILKRCGYNVIPAQDGSEALDLLASYKQPVHLLLTDVVMPGLNGKELFIQAAKKRPGLKVLYMSGYTGRVIAHSGMLGEDAPFIKKPFSVNTLATNVRKALDGDVGKPQAERSN